MIKLNNIIYFKYLLNDINNYIFYGNLNFFMNILEKNLLLIPYKYKRFLDYDGLIEYIHIQIPEASDDKSIEKLINIHGFFP